MAPPDPGETGNPFQSLLGDLMKMLGTSAPDQWEMTRSFALNVAMGGETEPNVEPVQRIRLEQLARVAELNVTEVSGMPVSPDGRRLTCVPVGRGDWTARALESWRPVLSAMAPPAGPPPEPHDHDDPGGGTGDAGGAEGLTGLLGQWATAIGPMFFGLQVGSVIGHLSQRALGQYPLSIPWAPGDELVLVPANIATFAEDWSIPEEEALLWVCTRELAAHSVLARPPIRTGIDDLLADVAATASAAQDDLAGRLRALGSPGTLEGTGMDLESLQGMFGDPEALLGDLLTPESRHSSERLTAVSVVIDAYADHVADLVGQKLVGSHRQIAEAFYRRRLERGKGEEAAGALFGLDLDQSAVDRGRSFVSGVIERAGEEGLAKLWSSASHLPTPAEVDAPGLWLERISLTDVD